MPFRTSQCSLSPTVSLRHLEALISGCLSCNILTFLSLTRMLSFLYSTCFFGHNYILIPVNIDSYLLIAFLSFPHEIVLEAHNINTKGCYTMDQLLDENIQKWSYIVISGPVQWYTLAPSFCSHLKQSPMCSSGEKRKLLFWLLKQSKTTGMYVCPSLLLPPKLLHGDVSSKNTFLPCSFQNP